MSVVVSLRGTEATEDETGAAEGSRAGAVGVIVRESDRAGGMGGDELEARFTVAVGGSSLCAERELVEDVGLGLKNVVGAVIGAEGTVVGRIAGFVGGGG